MINFLKVESDMVSKLSTNYVQTVGQNYLFLSYWNFSEKEDTKDIVIMVNIPNAPSDENTNIPRYNAKFDIIIQINNNYDLSGSILSAELDKLYTAIPLAFSALTTITLISTKYADYNKTDLTKYKVITLTYDVKCC